MNCCDMIDVLFSAIDSFMHSKQVRQRTLNNNNSNNNRIQRRNFKIFYNLLTAPRTVFNMYAQVAQAQSCANHVQHIERLSHATCRVKCHVV